MEGVPAVIFIWVLGAWILSAWACGKVAESRGRTEVYWRMIGLVYGTLALLVVAVLPQQDG